MTRKLPLLAYSLAVVVIILDQITKVWVLEGLRVALGERRPFLPGINMSLVYNRGISFGLFQSPEGQELIRWLLAVFSFAVAVALIVWVRKATKRLTVVAIGLVIGGALGNLVDRVRFGYVVDFIDVSPMTSNLFPWVFNVADSAITVGVALLLVETLITPSKPASKPPRDEERAL